MKSKFPVTCKSTCCHPSKMQGCTSYGTCTQCIFTHCCDTSHHNTSNRSHVISSISNNTLMKGSIVTDMNRISIHFATMTFNYSIHFVKVRMIDYTNYGNLIMCNANGYNTEGKTIYLFMRRKKSRYIVGSTIERIHYPNPFLVRHCINGLQ